MNAQPLQSVERAATCARIRVAMVEDDSLQAAEITELLLSDKRLELVGSWRSAEEASPGLFRMKPDLVLVDMGLPRQSGIQLVGALKPHLPWTQFMMLTVIMDSAKVVAALSAGATGYLLKKDAPQRLSEAIQDLMAGGSPMSSIIARQLVVTFQKPAPPALAESGRLSAREQEVLDRLARGFLYKEIAEELEIGLGSVRTYIGRIYAKLHARNRTEALMRTGGN